MKLKGIVLAVILSLASIMMPFNVYAETIDSHIRGRNYTYEPITYNEVQVSSNTYYENIGIIHITFELDDEYIGYVLPNYTIQYDNYFYGASSPNWGTLSKTFDRRIFINGSSFSFDITVNWNSININSAPGGDPFNYDSYTITSSDVTKYADIDSLDQIINILQDNQDIITDIYGELQTVVSNTSLANDYLEKISKLREFNIPFESFTFAYYLISKGYNITSFYDYNYYRFPVFEVNKNDVINSVYVTTSGSLSEYTGIMICNTNISNISQLSSAFTLSSGDFTSLVRLNRFYIGSSTYTLIKFNIGNFSSNGRVDIICNTNYTSYIMPIYFTFASNSDVSTEFALQFRLSNRLLDDLDIIAQGTQQSDSAASELESSNDQMADDMNDLATIENGYNQQFNNQLQQIDFTSPIQNNAGILPAANFVITIFNGLINNNPFSVLIIVVCILLIGKKVIGK